MRQGLAVLLLLLAVAVNAVVALQGDANVMADSLGGNNNLRASDAPLQEQLHSPEEHADEEDLDDDDNELEHDVEAEDESNLPVGWDRNLQGGSVPVGERCRRNFHCESGYCKGGYCCESRQHYQHCKACARHTGWCRKCKGKKWYYDDRFGWCVRGGYLHGGDECEASRRWECRSKICLGGFCCDRKYPYCNECDHEGRCSACRDEHTYWWYHYKCYRQNINCHDFIEGCERCDFHGECIDCLPGWSFDHDHVCQQLV